MKTTVEISDVLLADARKVAAREHTTVRALIEEGLRRVTADRAEGKSFKLRKITFGGKGLKPEFSGASWQQLREAAYEGRGT